MGAKYFMLKNQIESNKVINAPSGTKYLSLKGRGFKVKDKQDIEFFQKQEGRYEEVKASHEEVQKSVEDELREELQQIKGLDNASVEEIVHVYSSMENVETVVNKQQDLDVNLPEKQKQLVVDHVLEKNKPEELQQEEKEESQEKPSKSKSKKKKKKKKKKK